jgi:phosphoribosyl 1,2-cyclic phosphodiesterase
LSASLESVGTFGETTRPVSLTFQSLRSSSSGNCLLLCCGDHSILIDCGLKTQKECRALLDAHAGRLRGVLVTHAHGDHICYSALKIMQAYGTPVYCHDDVLPHVHRKHVGRLNSPLELTPFAGEAAVDVGGFGVRAFPVPHEPQCPTFGFVITCGNKKLVVCTDFHDPDAIRPHLCDADFVFIEANHDPHLLRLHPNYASHFHLSNAKAARLLCDAARAGRCAPRHVMLGHLSEQRNTESLARQAVTDHFADEDVDLDFELSLAPRRTASQVVTIA